MFFDLLFLAASIFGVITLGRMIKTVLEEDYVKNPGFYGYVGAGIAIVVYVILRQKYTVHSMIFIYALAVNVLWVLVAFVWALIDTGSIFPEHKFRRAEKLRERSQKTSEKKPENNTEKKPEKKTEKKPEQKPVKKTEKKAEKKPEKEDKNYREAFRYVNEGEYGYAMQAMVKAPEGYKDRDELLREWAPKAIEKGLEHYRNGDLSFALGSFEGVIRYDPDNEEARAYQTIVTMAFRAKNGGDLKYPIGSYPMLKDGKEGGIEWYIVSSNSTGLTDRMLAVSRYILDIRPLYEKDHVPAGYAACDWKHSDLRRWLNTEFLDHAFKDYEKDMIVPRNCSSSDGNYSDNVFLLTEKEENMLREDYEKTYPGAKYRIGITPYAAEIIRNGPDDIPLGVWVRPEDEGADMLSTPVRSSDGSISRDHKAYELHGVRPAVYLRVPRIAEKDDRKEDRYRQMIEEEIEYMKATLPGLDILSEEELENMASMRLLYRISGQLADMYGDEDDDE